MVKTVVVEVSQGCATVSYAPKGIDVIVIDWDNAESEGVCALCFKPSQSGLCRSCKSRLHKRGIKIKPV
jgi:hypothetical protein